MCGAQRSDGQGTVLRTSNGGRTWARQGYPLSAGVIMHAVLFKNQTSGWAVGAAGESPPPIAPNCWESRLGAGLRMRDESTPRHVVWLGGIETTLAALRGLR